MGREKMVDPIANEFTWLRAVFDSVQVGILLIDAKTRKIVEINPAALKLIELPREKILGKECHKILCPPEIRECPIIEKGHKVYNAERDILTGSGKSLPVLTTLVKLTINKHPFLLETVLDNTRRKGMEDQLEWQHKITAGIKRVFQETLTSKSDRDVAQVCLSVAEELTGSQLGWIKEYTGTTSPAIIALSDALRDGPGVLNNGVFYYLKEEVMQGGLKEALPSDQPLIINTEYFFERTENYSPPLPAVHRILSVPLKEGENSRGVIVLANKDTNYTDDDTHAIEMFSVAILETLARKRAQFHQQKILLEVTLRNQIDSIFLKVPDEDAYGEVLQLIMGALESSHGVFGYIAERNVLKCPAIINDGDFFDCRVKKLFHFPKSTWDGIWRKALVENLTTYVNKPLKVPWGDFSLSRAIAVPIFYQSRAIGLLFLGNKQVDYADDDVELLVTLSNSIAPILQARLEQQRLGLAREQAMHDLNRVQKDLRRIIDTANAPIFGIDTEEHVNEWNAMMEQLLGYSITEAIGLPFVPTWVPLEYQELMEEMLKITLQGMGTKNFEIPMHSRDGSAVVLLISSTPRLDETQQVVGAICVGQDLTELQLYRDHLEQVIQERTAALTKTNEELTTEITQRIKTEQALREAIERAKTASKAKSEFLANMSHELRTPLNSILGFAEILSDGVPGDVNADQKDLLDTILTSGQHLLKLINTILDLTRIEAGKEVLQRKQVSLRYLIEKCFQSFEPAAKKRNIHMQFDYNTEFEEVVLDETKTIEIFNNLLSNAIKFTPEGGSIGVLVEESEEKYTITVWDTGIGIAEEDLSKLFQPFQQLENPYSKQYAGTGLGLHLTKIFIELQGGQIWVNSKVNEGSAFTFTLPTMDFQ